MKSITVQELKSWMDNNEDFQLVDVREPHENEPVLNWPPGMLLHDIKSAF